MSKDEKVGPGRPPKHTQWKKGQSGNPRGRPKGRIDLKLVLEQELSEMMTFATPQGEREMSKLQAVVRRLIHEALSGKVQAIQDVLDRAERLTKPDENAATPELAQDDEAILRRALSIDPISQPDGLPVPDAARSESPS